MKIKIFLLICISILVMGLRLIYLFFKPAEPIMEYEFPTMTYEQLETKISNRNPKRLLDVMDSSKIALMDKTNFTIRFVSLGKDSLQFRFVTKMDKGYEYKTKKNHSKDSFPWLELYGISDSKGKYIGVFRKNREEHPELIKLFEDEFIKKINNGEVNMIERRFWDWF